MAKYSSVAKRRVRNKRVGKRQRTVQDLNAWEQAYGHQLTSTGRYRKILPYVLSITAYGEILFARLPITIVLFLISSVICWSSILAKETYVSYIRASYSERNRIVNMISQALSGGDATLFSALKQTIPSMNGELKHEFQLLLGLIARSARNDELHDWFVNEISKYREDVIFGQYLEQLETMNQEGVYTVDTFMSLTHYHNDLYQKQLAYIHGKDEQKQAVFTIVAIVFGLLCVMAFAVKGWSGWIKMYCYNPAGKVASVIFIIIYACLIKRFIKIYYDESVTTIGSDNKTHSIVKSSRHKADSKIQQEAKKQMVTLTLNNDNDRSTKPGLENEPGKDNKGLFGSSNNSMKFGS